MSTTIISPCSAASFEVNSVFNNKGRASIIRIILARPLKWR
jgi:hypothetical protein